NPAVVRATLGKIVPDKPREIRMQGQGNDLLAPDGMPASVQEDWDWDFPSLPHDLLRFGPHSVIALLQFGRANPSKFASVLPKALSRLVRGTDHRQNRMLFRHLERVRLPRRPDPVEGPAVRAPHHPGDPPVSPSMG